MNTIAWRATVHGVAKSWTPLSIHTQEHTPILADLAVQQAFLEHLQRARAILVTAHNSEQKGPHSRPEGLTFLWGNTDFTHTDTHKRTVKVKSLSHVRLFAIPWTVAYWVPRFMGFSRQGYWSGLPLPSPEDLPDPGIKPGLPRGRQMLYHLNH